MDHASDFGYFLSHPAKGEEVVISGVAGRFAGCDHINECRTKLNGKKDLVSQIRDSRWITKHPNVPKYAGLIKEIDKFDAGFCGTHYREAENSDPLERIFLEETLKAVMDAGINPADLKDTRTGIFIANSLFLDPILLTNASQYQTRIERKSLLMTQCRISTMLGVKGPALNVDTACSSSVTALEHAFKAIRRGECDYAIVGGGNMLQHPGSSIEFEKLGVYNRDGRCKVFDQNADGYVRSEAVTCVFLQRLNTARRAYAKILYTKTNCDGYSQQGITFPSFESQARLMTEVFQDSRFDVNDLGYFEFHGTGTVVGDAQEIKSVDVALGQKRNKPILVGSTKSNAGHAEIASGFLSIVKSLLALESGYIPPNINLTKINETFDGLNSGRLIVVTDPTPLPRDFIGINNFGIGGSNANIILEGLPQDKCPGKNDLPRIHLASGRNPDAVRTILSQVDDLDYASLVDQLFASDHPNHCYRGFVILEQQKTPKLTVKTCKFRNKLIIEFGKLEIVGEQFSQHQIVVNHMEKIRQILKSTHKHLESDKLHDLWLYNLCAAHILRKLELEPSSVHGNAIICDYFEGKNTLKQAIQALLSKDVALMRITSVPVDKETTSITSTRFVSHMYETIGRIYKDGFNPKLKNLYKTNFPVKRGTPSISPFVRLDYRKKWNVFKFGTVPSPLHSIEIEVDLKDDHYKYLSGHVVDGLKLLPATWYLFYAWQLLAHTKGGFTIDVPVLFQNCRFIKATAFYEDKSPGLEICLNSGSGRYEISVNKEIVACGEIFVWSREEQNEIDELKLTEGEHSLNVDQHDIYKELKLRGYEYEGLFNGLLQCNADASKGLVKWEKNWVAFLDSMLHIYLLDLDSKFCYTRLPIGVKRLMIDSEKHHKIAAACDNLLPVECNTVGNTIQCGGVFLNGLMAKIVNRNIQHSTPIVEQYVFIPNECDLNLEQSLSVNFQIVNENFSADRILVVEIQNNKSSEPPENSISSLMQAVTKTTSMISCNFETKHSLKDESNLQMVVGHNLLQSAGTVLEAINALRSDGFLLSCESADYNNNFQYNQLDTITTHHIDKDRTFILLRKVDRLNNSKRPEYIKLTEDLSWVEELKGKIISSGNIILYADDDRKNGIVGLIKSLRKEPGGRKILCCICDKGELHKEFCQMQMKKQMAINIFRQGKWGTYRHIPLDLTAKVETEDCHVTTDHPGKISNLQWYEGRKPSVEPAVNTMKIHCSALNFKDVLIATGAFRFDMTRLVDMETCIGVECAGVDSKGRRMAGSVLAGGLATTAEIEEEHMFVIPDDWSFEEAVTIPVVYVTLVYGLLVRMNLKKNSSMLIHTATGGVGLGAINVAIYFGCEIFVTVSSEEKRKYLQKQYPQILDDHIGNSRDTSFEQLIKRRTKGRGVDIVINSLTDTKLEASLRCLAKGGHFIEIGKSDAIKNNPLGLALLKNDISYHSIMSDLLRETCTPQTAVEIMGVVKKGIKLGFVKPLPVTIFKKDQVEDAFRFLMSGKHIGKVVVEIRNKSEKLNAISAIPKFFVSHHTSHIIVGGLGGFGLELVKWLISRGARNIVLCSRSGIQNGYQLYKMRNWKAAGIKVTISTNDATTLQGCKKLLEEAEKMGPIESIFNLALVLQDALFQNQTRETFENVLKPKSFVTKYLDEVSRTMCPHLKNFIAFSSAACGHGNAGQSNYGMANSITEGICERRRKEGFPALAIQWGLIADVGYVANIQRDSKLVKMGNIFPQKISSCLEVLDRLLKQDAVIVSSVVTYEQKSRYSGAKTAVEAVLQLLGVTKVSPQSTMAEIGMDSMKSVEILKVLELEFDIFLTQEKLQNMSLTTLNELETKRKANAQKTQSN